VLALPVPPLPVLAVPLVPLPVLPPDRILRYFLVWTGPCQEVGETT
jgi:hypothetical protein